MKQIEVQIMGQSYLLGCPEGGQQRMLEAVARVDEAMCKIRDKGHVKARERIAVLAALNIAFESTAAAAPASALASQALSRGPAADAGADPTASSSFDPSADDAQLAALVQRLDRVLGDDGRLL